MSKVMKAVVLGGSGMIGSIVVERLKAFDIDVFAASRRSGVDTMTGAGLEAVFSGADVVLDTSDVHSFDENTLQKFFLVSGENVAKAEVQAGVKHHITLSIVGVDQLLGNPYYKAKFGQEKVAKTSGIPCTIVRSTQFFEFLPTIAGGFAEGGIINPPDALLQPIAAGDVGEILAEIASGHVTTDLVQIAGPEEASIGDWLGRAFAVTNDERSIVVDRNATWFGAPLEQESLVPAHPDRVGSKRFSEWAATDEAKQVLGSNRYAEASADLAKQVTR